MRRIPPATEFLKRAFANKNIVKGIICHGLWLVAPAPRSFADANSRATIICTAMRLAYGARFVDQDLVVDGDLVTARTGKHCHLMARQIIEMLASRGRKATFAGDDSPAHCQLVAAD